MDHPRRSALGFSTTRARPHVRGRRAYWRLKSWVWAVSVSALVILSGCNEPADLSKQGVPSVSETALTADEIMARVKRQYREASSYQDDGVQKETSVAPSTAKPVEYAYKTRFERLSGRFLLTYDLPGRSYSVLRQANADVRSFDSHDDGPEQNESLLSALHIANGVSNGTALLIPCILLPAEINQSPFWGGRMIHDLRRVEDEKLHGAP